MDPSTRVEWCPTASQSAKTAWSSMQVGDGAMSPLQRRRRRLLRQSSHANESSSCTAAAERMRSTVAYRSPCKATASCLLPGFTPTSARALSTTASTPCIPACEHHSRLSVSQRCPATSAPALTFCSFASSSTRNVGVELALEEESQHCWLVGRVEELVCVVCCSRMAAERWRRVDEEARRSGGGRAAERRDSRFGAVTTALHLARR